MPPIPAPELGHILTLIAIAATSFIISNLVARGAGYKE